MKIENPEGKFWDVKLWWREGKNHVESGGHFMAKEGDTLMTVLEDVIRGRRAPRELLDGVSIDLRSLR